MQLHHRTESSCLWGHIWEGNRQKGMKREWCALLLWHFFVRTSMFSFPFLSLLNHFYICHQQLQEAEMTDTRSKWTELLIHPSKSWKGLFLPYCLHVILVWGCNSSIKEFLLERNFGDLWSNPLLKTGLTIEARPGTYLILSTSKFSQYSPEKWFNSIRISHV